MPMKITIVAGTAFDPETSRFIEIGKSATIMLEHSLLAISRWESKWKVPFFKENEKTFTREKLVDYVRCMTITQNVDPDVYNAITDKQLQEIVAYMNDPMTATVIKQVPGRRRNNSNIGTITSEVIYYQMAALRIPFEAQKWHINRLMMLLQIGAIEQEPPKKMGKAEAMAQQRALNAKRRAQHHSKG